jgi:hypothetical protein
MSNKRKAVKETLENQQQQELPPEQQSKITASKFALYTKDEDAQGWTYLSQYKQLLFVNGRWMDR